MILRVAHVLNSPGRGGVPQVAHALIQASDRSRVAPYLFHLKPGPTDGAPDCPVASASGQGGKTGAMVDLMDWLVANRIDILHCHSFRPNLYARLAGAPLRPRLRIVAHYHNTYDDKWADPRALALETHLGGVTDARIAVSPAVADHVADRLGTARDGIDVIANAIAPGRLDGADRARGRADLGVPADAPLIGLVGRVCRQKGPDIFVEAALSMLARNRGLHFVLIGDVEDGALAARLQTRIREAGHAEKIRFVGHSADIRHLLAALDILAAPSRWEGFGLAILEAMWLGIPVVASAVDAIPDVTAGTATLVPPEDARALARGLGHVLAHRPEGGIERARKIACAASWARSAAGVQAVHDRIAG